MTTKPISPKLHGLLDYALAGSLLTLPPLLNFSRDVRKIYAAEAVVLLTYIVLTDQPAALKPLIPFPTHGKIDPFNIAQFALQTGFRAFQKDRRAQLFNIGFTTLAGLTVLLTNWNGPTKNHP